MGRLCASIPFLSNLLHRPKTSEAPQRRGMLRKKKQAQTSQDSTGIGLPTVFSGHTTQVPQHHALLVSTFLTTTAAAARCMQRTVDSDTSPTTQRSNTREDRFRSPPVPTTWRLHVATVPAYCKCCREVSNVKPHSLPFRLLVLRNFSKKRIKLSEYEEYEQTFNPNRIPKDFVRVPLHHQSAGELLDSIVTAGHLRLQNPNFWRRCTTAVVDLADGFRVRELVSIINAYAKAKIRDERLFKSLARHIAYQAANSRASDLAVTVQAYARVAICHEGLFSALALHIRQRLPELSSRGVATVMWSYGRLGVHNESLFDAVMRQIVDTIENYSTLDVTQVLSAMSSLKYCHSGALSSLCMQIRLQLKNFSVTELLVCTHALSQVRHYDDELMKVLHTFYVQNLRALPLPELPPLLHALTRLERCSGDFSYAHAVDRSGLVCVPPALTSTGGSTVAGSPCEYSAVTDASQTFPILYRLLTKAIVMHVWFYSLLEIERVRAALAEVHLTDDLLNAAASKVVSLKLHTLTTEEKVSLLEVLCAYSSKPFKAAEAAAAPTLTAVLLALFPSLAFDEQLLRTRDGVEACEAVSIVPLLGESAPSSAPPRFGDELAPYGYPRVTEAAALSNDCNNGSALTDEQSLRCIQALALLPSPEHFYTALQALKLPLMLAAPPSKNHADADRPATLPSLRPATLLVVHRLFLQLFPKEEVFAAFLAAAACRSAASKDIDSGSSCNTAAARASDVRAAIVVTAGACSDPALSGPSAEKYSDGAKSEGARDKDAKGGNAKRITLESAALVTHTDVDNTTTLHARERDEVISRENYAEDRSAGVGSSVQNATLLSSAVIASSSYSASVPSCVASEERVSSNSVSPTERCSSSVSSDAGRTGRSGSVNSTKYQGFLSPHRPSVSPRRTTATAAYLAINGSATSLDDEGDILSGCSSTLIAGANQVPLSVTSASADRKSLSRASRISPSFSPVLPVPTPSYHPPHCGTPDAAGCPPASSVGLVAQEASMVLRVEEKSASAAAPATRLAAMRVAATQGGIHLPAECGKVVARESAVSGSRAEVQEPTVNGAAGDDGIPSPKTNSAMAGKSSAGREPLIDAAASIPTAGTEAPTTNEIGVANLAGFPANAASSGTPHVYELHEARSGAAPNQKVASSAPETAFVPTAAKVEGDASACRPLRSISADKISVFECDRASLYEGPAWEKQQPRETTGLQSGDKDTSVLSHQVADPPMGGTERRDASQRVARETSERDYQGDELDSPFYEDWEPPVKEHQQQQQRQMRSDKAMTAGRHCGTEGTRAAARFALEGFNYRGSTPLSARAKGLTESTAEAAETGSISDADCCRHDEKSGSNAAERDLIFAHDGITDAALSSRFACREIRTKPESSRDEPEGEAQCSSLPHGKNNQEIETPRVMRAALTGGECMLDRQDSTGSTRRLSQTNKSNTRTNSRDSDSCCRTRDENTSRHSNSVSQTTCSQSSTGRLSDMSSISRPIRGEYKRSSHEKSDLTVLPGTAAVGSSHYTNGTYVPRPVSGHNVIEVLPVTEFYDGGTVAAVQDSICPNTEEAATASTRPQVTDSEAGERRRDATFCRPCANALLLDVSSAHAPVADRLPHSSLMCEKGSSSRLAETGNPTEKNNHHGSHIVKEAATIYAAFTRILEDASAAALVEALVRFPTDPAVSLWLEQLFARGKVYALEIKRFSTVLLELRRYLLATEVDMGPSRSQVSYYAERGSAWTQFCSSQPPPDAHMAQRYYDEVVEIIFGKRPHMQRRQSVTAVQNGICEQNEDRDRSTGTAKRTPLLRKRSFVLSRAQSKEVCIPASNRTLEEDWGGVGGGLPNSPAERDTATNAVSTAAGTAATAARRALPAYQQLSLSALHACIVALELYSHKERARKFATAGVEAFLNQLARYPSGLRESAALAFPDTSHVQTESAAPVEEDLLTAPDVRAKQLARLLRTLLRLRVPPPRRLLVFLARLAGALSPADFLVVLRLFCRICTLEEQDQEIILHLTRAAALQKWAVKSWKQSAELQLLCERLGVDIQDAPEESDLSQRMKPATDKVKHPPSISDALVDDGEINSLRPKDVPHYRGLTERED